MMGSDCVCGEGSNFQLVRWPQQTQIFVESCVDVEVAHLSILMFRRLWPWLPPYISLWSTIPLGIGCSVLSAPSKGDVVLGGITVGSTATYTCDSGYVLVGESVRVCQPSGEWSGAEPSCRCKISESVCTWNLWIFTKRLMLIW